jgi:hypothetical protein
LVSIFPLEEDEVFKPFEEVINPSDVGKFMEHPSNTIENYINNFICVHKQGCDIVCFSFDGDPIYEIEGNFQIKNAEIFPLEDLFPYMDDQDIWKPNGDMIIDLSYPPRDGLL